MLRIKLAKKGEDHFGKKLQKNNQSKLKQQKIKRYQNRIKGEKTVSFCDMEAVPFSCLQLVGEGGA